MPPQLSAALTDAVFCAGIALAQMTVTGTGQLIVGATLSNTVIICVQIAVLLHASAARNVRVTVNLFAQLTLLVTSLTKVNVTVPVQLSVALTPAVVCAGMLLAHTTVTGFGQVMLGATLSNTVIVWLQVAVLLHKSVARNVRVTVYLLMQLTLLVTSLTNSTLVTPLQLSVAATPVVFCGGTEPEQVTVIGFGQLMVGATLSNTVIVCAQVVVLLHASDAR